MKYQISLPLALVCLAACDAPEHPFRRETTSMDTYLSVTIYDAEIEEMSAHDQSGYAFQEIAFVESIATDYSDLSEIGRINLAAGLDSIGVSDEIRSMVLESISFSETSEGAFDVTVGPLVHQWNFLSESPVVPPNEVIGGLLPLVGYRMISTSSERIFLRKKGMRLDLGGIAKGFAVDRAIDRLRKNGVRNFIIDLGGNLGIYWEGTSLRDSTRATIFIRHPRREGEFFGHFDVGTSGVATSGDYQRYFMVDGIRYHHLLDPRTGMPARDLVSVTVIAPNARTADALSTTVFVLGRERGMELIESLPDVEGILIFGTDDSLKVALSSGMEGRLVLGTSE
jgi:thiamine biosynthesis lipoprotein